MLHSLPNSARLQANIGRGTGASRLDSTHSPYASTRFLVAARTEVSRLARESEDRAVPALRAIEPGKAVVRIAAFEKPLDDVFLDSACEAVAAFQLRRVTACRK
jgi:hypothetical protein